MSLDISLRATIETTVVDKNITHNLAQMWREAGVYDALYNSEGCIAGDLLPTLERGLRDMIANPSRFKHLSADNGWGTYEQAVPWLSELVREFKKYPEGIISISK